MNRLPTDEQQICESLSDERGTATPSRKIQLKNIGLVALWLLLGAGYMAATISGMRVLAMAIVATMVGVLLAVSGRYILGWVIGVALVVTCVYFAETVRFIAYAPPFAAFAFMAFLFYRTLRPGVEPLITRVARMEHPDLPPDMARHARMLTWVWSLCFVLLFVIALVLAPLLELEVWSQWVHGLGYILPGALFLGEYAYRRHRFRERAHGSLRVLIPNIVRISREAALSTGQRDAGTGQ